MKHEQTDMVFSLRFRKGVTHRVVPFNGEIESFLSEGKMINGVSWSHGFTHLKLEDGTYVGFCGVDHFERNAKMIGQHVQRDWIKV